jgi:sirohydrochlorin cobaltochelatase
VVENVRARRVFLAPLFISDGYFSEEVIPSELGFRAEGETDFKRLLSRSDQTFFYCRAVGTHLQMTTVVLDRARQIVAHYPFPRAPKPRETTLFIAGHGTEQSGHSRSAIDWQVEQVRAEKLYAAVHAVFLDEDPRIGECYRLCETKNMVVVPFFISNGMHVQEDIPILLGEPARIVRQRLERTTAPWRNPAEKHGKLVWYTQSVGTDPLLADVILERVREQAKMLARKSVQ